MTADRRTKIYVAARYARREEVLTTVVPVLERQGHTVTSRWLSGEPPSPAQAQVDLDDVDACDVLLAILDPAGSLNSGGGRFFEMGYAYARGKRVVVWGDYEIVFCLLPRVEVYSTLDLAVRAVGNFGVNASITTQT